MTTEVTIEELHKEHPLVQAARAMVKAHGEHEMMFAALEQVKNEFPNIRTELLITLWVGINAKNREGLD